MDNNEDFTKTSAYRLKQVISFVGAKSSNIFADSIGADQSELSRILSGKRDLSAAFAYKIVKKHKAFSFEWLVDGEGEMLKTKETLEENEPLGAGYYFPSNLSFLIEMRDINLPSIIPISQQIITDLINGNRRPSVALLIRLREVFDVAIDAMLLYDLRLPENMEHLRKDNASPSELEALKKTLETLIERMEEMKKAQDRMESEMDILKQKKEVPPVL